MQNRLQAISRLDVPLQKIALVLARVTLGLLFFTQLWWKVPPVFWLPPTFRLPPPMPLAICAAPAACATGLAWSQPRPPARTRFSRPI